MSSPAAKKRRKNRRDDRKYLMSEDFKKQLSVDLNVPFKLLWGRDPLDR